MYPNQKMYAMENGMIFEMTTLSIQREVALLLMAKANPEISSHRITDIQNQS